MISMLFNSGAYLGSPLSVSQWGQSRRRPL